MSVWPAASRPARAGKASGPPPPTMAKDIPSTACQVMALWNSAKGTGKASTT